MGWVDGVTAGRRRGGLPGRGRWAEYKCFESSGDALQALGRTELVSNHGRRYLALSAGQMLQL